MTWVTPLWIGFLLALPQSVWAGACAQDVQKFCGGIKKGAGRVARCLDRSEANLSPACKDNRKLLKDRRKKTQQAMDSCSKETQKFCKGVPVSGGALHQCLSEKSGQAGMSKGCQTALNPP